MHSSSSLRHEYASAISQVNHAVPGTTYYNMNMTAAANKVNPKALLTPWMLLPPDTVTGVLLATGGFVDCGTPPVGWGAVVFAVGWGNTAVLVTGGAAEHWGDDGMMGVETSTLAKLAQVMRVLLA
jgi:hypothetical protein